jgi:aspartyl/asparaginyl beta-hydroxylase (cupin superfamily)
LFVDEAQFPFLDDLRSARREIRAECLALRDDSFEPWVQREMYGTGWSVYGLVAFGTRIDAALATCPRTAEALHHHVPGVTTAGFSRMIPGTYIRPHEGWVATVYRAHLGLVVPQGDCALRWVRRSDLCGRAAGAVALWDHGARWAQQTLHGQIARASSVNAVAIRSVEGASTASS